MFQFSVILIGSLLNLYWQEIPPFVQKYRVLPRNQIHLNKWPTKFENGGPFQKIWGSI